MEVISKVSRESSNSEQSSSVDSSSNNSNDEQEDCYLASDTATSDDGTVLAHDLVPFFECHAGSSFVMK